MIRLISRPLAIILLAILSHAAISQVAPADPNEVPVSVEVEAAVGSAEPSATSEETSADVNPSGDASSEQGDSAERQRKAVVQLTEIQASLQESKAARKALRQKISAAGDDVPESLESELREINSEIELLEKTFEQIAIGDVDLTVFGVEDKAFDWREELVQVVKPLIENVKGLTEKPRKIENLRRVISEKSASKEAALDALNSSEQLIAKTTSKPVLEKLSDVKREWKSRMGDLEREIQLAKYQLDSLEGKNVPWIDVLKTSAIDFVSGRGLTLLLVLLAATLVLFFMRGILWVIRKRTSESQDRSSKVRYRLAAYGYRLLTGILMAISIMTVLYFRQDLLLMAIMVVVFVGLALALKNVLPNYIAEGRILLNMGGVREKERIIYNGLPWEVSAINMYSRFTNPEIRGGLRIPIGQMHDMISRPNAGDSWFPSSEGDWVLNDDGRPLHVIRQSVDIVELRDLDSITRFMPSADYFEAGFPNISRADAFRVALQFGIDYATQTENVEKVEAAFKQGMVDSFVGTPYETCVVSVSVDFHSAGDSSLNYFMVAKFKPDAAQYYNRIKRRIQRACVMVCNENGWGIPFPQVSVHLPSNTGSADES